MDESMLQINRTEKAVGRTALATGLINDPLPGDESARETYSRNATATLALAEQTRTSSRLRSYVFRSCPASVSGFRDGPQVG
jgi:hypothetical protein